MSGQIRKVGKLSLRYIGPFEVLEKVGTVVYRLALLPALSGVHAVFHVSMLLKYTPDPTHGVDWSKLVVDTDGTFEEGSVRIMDSRDQVLRRKTVKQHGYTRTRYVPVILSYLETELQWIVIL